MGLKERNMGKFGAKFCHVVDQLITLEELGFKEDGYGRWNYILWEKGAYSKSLVASGNYLYLRDQQGDKYTDVSLCILWNKGIAGYISKQTLKRFIKLLERGNVRT